jgi:hypothetical protein
MAGPKKVALVGLIAMALSCASCGSRFDMNNYTQAVRSGFKKIPESMQIEKWFGEADHFISYSGPNVQQHWYTEVFFDGRYVLTMRVDVRTSPAFSDIIEVPGEPEFFLHEVEEVSDESGTGAKFTKEWRFGRNDWKKVNDANGDFSVIGITIKKNQPVQHFEAYARGQKEPRIRVRPGDD